MTNTRLRCSIMVLALISAMPVSDGCCNYPTNLTGEWYWGRAAQIEDPNSNRNGQRPFYKDYVNETTACTLDAYTTYDSPTSDVATTISWVCPDAGESINGSFYLVGNLLILYRCVSYTLSAAGDLRFFRVTTEPAGTWTASATPQMCYDALLTDGNFRLDMRLPLISANNITCPWDSADYGEWQVTYQTDNVTFQCEGDQNSIFNLQKEYFQMKLCANTGIPAGISESTNVQMRCLRTWEGNELAGLGDDSLGTFILIGEDNADLDTGISPLFIARYLKRGNGDHVLAVDWPTVSQITGFYVDAFLNPETAYTTSSARVYVLQPLDTPTLPDTTSVPQPSASEDNLGSSHTQGLSDSPGTSQTVDESGGPSPSQTLDDSDGPGSSQTADDSDDVGASQTADVSDGTGASQTQLNSNDVGASQTADASNDIDASQTADDSDDLNISQTADASNDIDASQTADDSDGLDASQTADDSDDIDASQTVDDSDGLDASQTADNSNDINASQTADDSDDTDPSQTADDSDGLDASQTADDSDDLNISQTADNSDGLDASQTADDSDGLDASQTADDSDGLDASQTADDSNDINESQTVGDSDGIDASQTADESDGLDASQTADDSNDINASQTADDSDGIDASQTADDSDDLGASQTADASDGLDASQTADDSNDINASQTADASDDIDASQTAHGSDDLGTSQTQLNSNDLGSSQTQDISDGATASQTVGGSGDPGVSQTAEQSNNPVNSQTQGASDVPTASQTQGASYEATPSQTQVTSDDPVASQTPDMTESPVINPTTTIDVVPSSSTVPGGTEEDIGIGLTTVDGDFDTLTNGDPEQYCNSTEGQIADAAQVDRNRVDNVECAPGSVRITTHIFAGDEGEISIEQALINLENAQDRGLRITAPDGTVHQISADRFERYLMKPNGDIFCLGDVCGTIKYDKQDDGFDEALVYTVVAVGIVLIVATVLFVLICVVRREDPAVKGLPFDEEEDSFGRAKQWQVNYMNIMKEESK